jgi:fibronectin-binding autotransporter adhesin
MTSPSSFGLHRISRGMRVIAMILGCVVCCPLAYGATVTWDGSTDMTWTQPDSTSWSGATYNSGDTALFAGSGTGTVTITGTVTPGQIDVTSGPYALSGVIGGSGGIAKSGTGTLTLSGSAANAYAGLTDVSGGTLSLSKTAGVNAVAGDLTITGAAVTFGANNQIADTAAVTMSGASSYFNGTSGVVADILAFDETIGSLDVSGGVFLAGGLGSTTGFTVTGEANFTGGVGNTSYIQNSAGLASFGSLSLAGLTSADFSTATPVANRFFVFGNNAQQSVVTVGSGGLSLDGSNVLLNNGNAGSRLVLNGDVTTIGSATSAILAATGTGTINPVWLSGTAGTVTRTFTTGGGGANLTVTAPITNGSATTAGITKAGPGTLTLSGTGANTYSGVTTVSAGVLTLAKTAGVNAVAGNLTIENAAVTFTNSSQIADTAAVTMSGSNSFFNGTSYNNGVAGNLALDETFGSLTVSGGVFFPGGANATTGLAVTGAASFTGGAGNTQYFQNSGGLASFGSLSLVGMNSTAQIVNTATPNQFALAGSSTARQTTLTVGSGGLSLEGSNLNLSLGNTVGSLGSRIVLDGDVSTTGGSASSIFAGTGSGAQAGTRAVELSSTAGSHVRTFTVADVTSSAATDLTVGVPITNGVATSGGITKAGPGTLLLSAANTFTGPTSVSAGTLALGAGGSLADSAAISVASGATFDVSALTGGLTIAADQSLGGAGSILGSLAFGADSKLAFSSSLTVNSGTVTFNGFGINDIIGLDGNLVSAGTYTLLGGDATFDLTNALNVGAVNAVDIGGGKTAYLQQGSLQVEVVPEPAGVAVWGLGLVVVGVAARRWRR